MDGKDGKDKLKCTVSIYHWRWDIGWFYWSGRTGSSDTMYFRNSLVRQ